MTAGFRITYVLLGMFLLACLVSTAAAASLGIEWKERPYNEASFTGVKFSENGTLVWAGGDQMILKSWDSQNKWGGRAGTIASMSDNGEYIVLGYNKDAILIDNTMVDLWTRTMDGVVKAVAVSKTGNYVITADNKGNYNSWATNGEFYGRTTDDIAKQIAVSPLDDFVVATTENGLRIYSPKMNPIWSDNTSGTLDTYIIISSDGKTILTFGGNRLSSHTSTGETNWMVNPTKEAIIDMACNRDCSAIILGSQDGTILALDRYGTTRWTYKTGQWVNAVAISESASVVAAGGLDGTVYLLDRTGNLLTQKKVDSNIRQRSLAISRDGARIAVADQLSLYGISVMGNTDPGMETFTLPPLDPVKAYTQETATPALTPVIPVTTVTAIETTAQPTPAPTQESPAGMIPVLGALAAAGIVLVIRRG
ncbi:MAG: WD40 repeat domain-containing protein [Methanoregula sp.]|nr:WD40 repeat domain-containing protein [Methanoregula sp.]